LTPQTLGGWNITGTDAATLSQQSPLTLPAGTQLARAFASGELALKVSTAPAIGQNPEDWPVLEFGSAALVFSRATAEGQLVLVLGDEPPLELPFTFPLNPGGQSAETLEVVLRRTGSTISLTVAGQTLVFPSAMAAGDPTGVVISSGSAEPWAFRLVELTTGEGRSLVPEGAGPRGERTGGRKIVAGGMGAAPGADDWTTDRVPVPDKSAGQASSAPAAAAVTLEIFTPPSIRYGRPDSARVIAAQLKK